MGRCDHSEKMTVITTKIIIYFLICKHVLTSNTKRHTSYLDKFTNCPGIKLKNFYDNVEISYTKTGDIKINYDVIINEVISDPVENTWIVERCTSVEALDTCTSFGSFKTKKFCRLIQSKGEAWSGFVECVKPDWKCPLNKGFYHGRNCTLSPSSFSFFPLYGSYWKITSEVRSLTDEKLKLCMLLEGGIRVHSL